MQGFEILTAGFGLLSTTSITFVYIAAGVMMGLFFGAIPGLTGALSIALVLPFTFSMEPVEGMAILIALYVGSTAGGLVSATLLNIPGTPSSLVTCFDGSPMARNGKPEDALTLGAFASCIGGLLSAFFLVTISPQLAQVALLFGPWEYFGLGIFGICIVVTLCSNDRLKGYIGISIGCLFSMVGVDPILNERRMTFDFKNLDVGLDNVATLMGIFALSEILSQIVRMSKRENAKTIRVHKRVTFFPRAELMRGNVKNLIRSALIGTGIGILPGVGSTTSSLVAYNQAKQNSKTPEAFGTGCPDGIIASEAANNACCGGALVPMLSMGIPGDTITSILIGGLMVHGLSCGPLLFRETDLIGGIFLAFIIANILMYVFLIIFMKGFIRILSIPFDYLIPVILVCCILGSFSINTRIFDCWVFLVMGIVGYLLLKGNFSLPPIVLGYILGPVVEKNFRIAMISNKGDVTTLFASPIGLAFTIIGIIAFVWPIIKELKEKKIL